MNVPAAGSAALRQKLAEAEATIQALLSDQIDAVVDSVSKSPILLFKAQEALRDSEERFRCLFESGIIGVMIADRAGMVLEANDTFLQMLGYTRERLERQQLSWSNLTPPEWRGIHTGVSEQLEVRGSSRPFEKEYLHKDGSRVPVLVGVAALDERRRLTVVTDLSARKLAEARKIAVIDAALDAVVGMDSGGAITEWNPAAETTFGYARREILGRPLVEVIVPPRLRREHCDGLARYLRTGEARLVGKRVKLISVRRDGTEFPVELSISGVHSGKTQSFVAFIRDISERKRVEAALLERVQVAALGADIGQALDGTVSLRDMLQQCCDAMETHLGAALVRIWTLVPRTACLELQASAGLSRALDGAHASIPVTDFKGGLFAEARALHVSDDAGHDPRIDNPEWAEREGIQSLVVHPLLAGGELLGALAVFGRAAQSEIALAAIASAAVAVAVRIRGKLSEQANSALEEQLRQSQKMEAVGQLAGGIAHDFNNLLSVVLSYSEMAIADLDPMNPLRGDIEEIHHAGTRAADLTRQLLMFSRQQLLEPKILDLNDVLSTMDKMLRRLVVEDVELSTVPAPSLGLVRADRGSIEQVVMNLVLNARDAMPAGGKLTIETASVMLDDEYARSHFGAKPGWHVMLSVTDTGSGMDKLTLNRIFEPFFTTKDKSKGTGLGLSTVHGIVQQSGGTIWVYSEPGIGTSFRVYLPEVSGSVDAGRQKSPLASLRGSETVLLVEDEDQVRDVARGILRRHGYTVLDARGAGEALLLAENHPGIIHLLLSDVVMPGMSGPELAKRLLLIRPGVKVLCMSGYTDDAAVRHGVVDASLAYLQKPLTVEALTRRVREVLGVPGLPRAD